MNYIPGLIDTIILLKICMKNLLKKVNSSLCYTVVRLKLKKVNFLLQNYPFENYEVSSELKQVNFKL